MEAVTFLADVQRNETALIAATEYVNSYGGVLFFKLRREVSGNSLLSFGYLTDENGVYANLYSCRSTTRNPLANLVTSQTFFRLKMTKNCRNIKNHDASPIHPKCV